MKIEYLDCGAPDWPLIRLSEFDPDEAETLQRLFRSLADGTASTIALHEHLGFSPIDNLRLTLRTANGDFGVERVPGELHGFELRLTQETFDDLAELTEPFTEAELTRAFQWLSERVVARLLLSPSGWW